MPIRAKKFIIFFIGICLLVMVILSVVGTYFFNIAIKRKTRILSEENIVQVNLIQPTPIDKKGTRWVEDQDYDTWKLTSEDGLKLTGYFIKAKKNTNKTVILAHGYTSMGKDMGEFAKFYYEKLGYNVLMPDDRSHGRSEGEYIGFGWLDRKDYLQWIQKVIDYVGDDSQIVLHGVSMGAATVMMISGEKMPKQVKAVVEDCGYTSVIDQLTFQLKQMYDLPKFPIINVASLVSKLRAGYSFEEASAIDQIKNDKVPMLFIHGSEDSLVPVEMVYKLYEACPAKKELLVVKGAEHALSYKTNKKVYQKTLKSFLKKYIN